VKVAQVTEDVGCIRSGFSALTGGSAGMVNNPATLFGLLAGAIKKGRGK